MGVWSIVATVAGGWCVLSVVVAVVLGHAIAGRSLRSSFRTMETLVEDALEAAATPVAMLSDALAGDDPALDAAV
ncbi:hypothetical protein [Jatrophihabitans endophyticus]|uniref:hypothetical protein n=1 Tax=Jatrophihabitans endophyticus TaxID=1206085 RepID=UPI0019F68F46|nr:hypothetical protein [Jatrophihabitans endophyticus]MBE7189435.1 hypothetical protein [Jatrophihabitans endophyticus]